MVPALLINGGTSTTIQTSYTWQLMGYSTSGNVVYDSASGYTPSNGQYKPGTIGKYWVVFVANNYWSTGGKNQSYPFAMTVGIAKNGISTITASIQSVISFANNCNCYNGNLFGAATINVTSTTDYYNFACYSDNTGITFNTTEWSWFKLLGV